MISYPLPLLGFCAFSGAGKTTLLRHLLPLLQAAGRHVGVVKHAHHEFEIDYPGKDSYELRKAGAEQMVVASRKRMAWIREFDDHRPEPSLQEALKALNTASLDLVLVEGFKTEHFPKIEVYRADLGKPLLFPDDSDVIAIATDAEPRALATELPQLNLNKPAEIADFILNRWLREM
ncbi:MAG: molybdopterin-guanine dinucleotide biosynthesis protein B [Pseudomonadota bacterium]|nr:molybdopterin-guanine dinucleotide biosynthesis protein B [Pseudomonadota bacterium]